MVCPERTGEPAKAGGNRVQFTHDAPLQTPHAEWIGRTVDIADAIKKCLAYSGRFDSPSRAALDLVGLMKSEGVLNDDDCDEVLRRVFGELAERSSRATNT